jgi:uncharacterized FlaG/YvyC family protein
MNVSVVGNNNYVASTAAAVAPVKPQADGQRQLTLAARAVNQSGALGRNQIVFSIDSQTRQRVVLIEDRETHDVVQQIPPEYVLEWPRIFTHLLRKQQRREPIRRLECGTTVTKGTSKKNCAKRAL